MKVWNAVGLIAALVLATSVSTQAEETKMDREVKDTIALFKKSDSKMQKLFNDAYGYAVLPTVGKGAIGIGGAEGRGQVFDQGKLVGQVKMTQLTVGAQLGGQEYAEVIFFETKDTMEAFKKSKWTMSAEASAVAAAEGASAVAKYHLGVLVFTLAKSGLMFEASIGGQKFEYTPIVENEAKALPRD